VELNEKGEVTSFEVHIENHERNENLEKNGVIFPSDPMVLYLRVSWNSDVTKGLGTDLSW